VNITTLGRVEREGDVGAFNQLDETTEIVRVLEVDSLIGEYGSSSGDDTASGGLRASECRGRVPIALHVRR
jgi:hypothetical protein